MLPLISMDYGFDHTPLVKALLAYFDKHGWGAWKKLELKSKVSSSNISRIANTGQKPKSETWDKLYRACPDEIPPPPHPVGRASDYYKIRRSKVDENSFCVRIHGDSMSPTLNEGDIVVVVPSRELTNGCLCFATWPDDFGLRHVKRYRKLNNSILLESDNKSYEPIIINQGTEDADRIRIYRVVQRIHDL